MQTSEILGEEIWICSKDEAQKLWNEKKKDRHRIWLEDEVNRGLLLDPAQVSMIMERKKSPKGYVYKGEAL